MPYYQCEIISRQPRDVVIRRIRNVVADEPPLPQRLKALLTRRDPEHPLFFGEVGRTHFRLYRPRGGYTNHFLPVIHGHLTTTSQGTRIRITMHPHALAIVALVVIGFLSFMQRWPEPVIPWTFLIILVALALQWFYPEATKARRLLERVVTDEVS